MAATQDDENGLFLDAAEALGLVVQTSSGVTCPTTLLDSKDVMAEKVMQLSIQHRFQVRQRHVTDTISYSCKSFPECPFFIRGRLSKSGQVKITKSNFTHNHELGVQKLPRNSRNSMLNSKTLAQSVLDAGIDYVNATASQLQQHIKTAFGADVSTARVYSLKRLLTTGSMGNDVNQFARMPRGPTMKRKADEEDKSEEDDDDDDDYRPLPTEVEHEKDMLKRQDREHRWEMERRRVRMHEITDLRLEGEAKVTRRILDLQAQIAEVQAKVAHAKARHELVQVGIAPDQVHMLL